MKKFLFLFCCIMLVTGVAFASVVTVEEKSVIIPNQPDKTKEIGLGLTLQKAMQSFIFDLVTKPTADANYERLNTTFYKPYKDFITKYEILSEKDEGQFHYIKAKVEIDDVKVKGQLTSLGIQPGVGGKPRVAVLASEQNVDGTWATSYYNSIYFGGGGVAHGEADFNICEGKVSDVISSAGFPLIDLTLDPTEVKRAYKFKSVFDQYDHSMTDLPPAQASSMIGAVDNDVQIVVACKALAKNNGRVSSQFNSIGANVTCKATDIKAKRIIGTSQASAATPHIDPITGGNEALKKACAEAAEKILEKINR